MTSFKDNKVLVVGGAGFIGSNLVLRLLADSPRKICIVDNLLSSQIESVPEHPTIEFIYGPREILGAGQWRGTLHTVWRNVIPTFIWKALHKEALPLENRGEASRDFVYVEDLVEGLYRAALRGEPGEVYNLASGQQTK